VEDFSVKMVERIASILRLLGARDAQGVGLAEICALTDLRKTTAHRLLAALSEAGLVYQDVTTRHYRLGYAAAALARSAFEQHVAGAARPSLLRLAEATGDTAFASIREGTAAICVAREAGSFPIRTLTLSVGDRRPLGVGAGSLALLAFLPDATIENILARNAAWLRDFQDFTPANLRKLVARTRKEGFALNEGRIVAGMNAVAVPVRDERGEPIAALSIAAIRDRMTARRIGELVALLHNEVRILGDMLRPPAKAAG
jgi:DNA-binding IclR family transcriptional regulator